MLVSEAISEILRVVQNNNRSAEALIWLKQTIVEIQSLGRWNFLVKDAVRDFAQYVALPADCYQIFDPIVIDENLSGTLQVDTATLSSASVGVPYTATLTASMGVSNTWQSPGSPWQFELKRKAYAGRQDYWMGRFGIEFSRRFTQGVIWLMYYRKITVPTATTDTIDLPDEFVYNLAIYGASRKGLLGEDDYDRLEYAETMFKKTVVDMIDWDSQRKVANAALRALDQFSDQMPPFLGPVWPSNYAL